MEQFFFSGAAWWSMASHLAAQDYLARLQASGLNFPSLADPYASLATGLPSSLTGSSHHGQGKSKNSRGSKSHGNAKDKSSPFSHQQQRSSSSPSLKVNSSPAPGSGKPSKNSPSLSIQPSSSSMRYQQDKKAGKSSSSSSASVLNDMTYNLKQLEKLKNSGNNVSISSGSSDALGGKMSLQTSSSIFNSPMNMVSVSDKGAITSAVSTANSISSVGIPSSILR